jgi:hypothetical protein
MWYSLNAGTAKELRPGFTCTSKTMRVEGQEGMAGVQITGCKR